MKEQVKLMLKGLSEDTGAPFTKEVHTLDEVKSCGNYTVIGRNVSTANGLPAISGKKHNCFCCEAKLTVTCCYPESESQSDSAYGQCLTICDRETGETNSYTRSIAPTKNKGKWSAWKMVATGNIDLISQNSDIHEKFSNMTDKIDTEVLRAMSAEEALNTNMNELKEALDYTADYTPEISNGTQGNAGNTTAVRLSKKIPGEVGKTYTIITNRPPDEGCIYVYGLAVYSSLEGGLYQYYSRTLINYDANSTVNYVTLKEGEVGFNFVIAQLNETTGEYKQLRAKYFDEYEIKIKTSNVIDSISETLRTLTDETPIYKRNTDRVIALNAMCRNRKSTTAPSKDFQLLICTDSHGDKQTTKNSIDALNAFPTLDAWIHCGDILRGFYSPEGIETFAECVASAKKPFFAVPGNHDVGNTAYVAACATHEQVYTAFIKPSVDAGWLKAGEYTEGKSYWYHDDATYKIRLIGLYEYDDPMDFDTTYWKPIPYEAGLPEIKNNTTFEVGDKANPAFWNLGSDYFKYTAYSFECVKACTISGTTFYDTIKYMPKYRIQRGTRVIRQEQAQWFLDTLASTPTGYGVIVAMHNPFSDTATSVQAKFTQTAGVKGSAYSQNSMQTDFIRNAVVAFIKGVNYSEEVVMKGDASYLNANPSGGGEDYAYLVEKDFSKKNSNVNFLGFVGGHTHIDFIWKDASENIYQVTPCCTTADITNAKNNDIRRTSADGPAKDSLTAVSFASGRIALAKIGVNVTENGTARDYEVISK